MWKAVTKVFGQEGNPTKEMLEAKDYLVKGLQEECEARKDWMNQLEAERDELKEVNKAKDLRIAGLEAEKRADQAFIDESPSSRD